MAPVFQPQIRIPEPAGGTAPDDGALTPEQRVFVAALRQRYRDNVAAMAASDVETILAFFTDDAVWMGAGWPTRRGKAELRTMFEAVAGTAQVRFTSLHAAVEGRMGWNMVDYGVTPNDPAAAPWTFRTTFHWTSDGAEWRCNGVLCFPLEETPG